MVKYNSWCNDKPMKAIMKEILGTSNGWTICPKEIQLTISDKILEPTRKYLKPLKFQSNPILRNNLENIIDPDILGRTIDLHELIDQKSRPDLICFKDDILIMMENKTRLFNKVQADVTDKLSDNEKELFDHYFIRYHFDNPYWALNTYRDLIVFKKNTEKRIKDRISETFSTIKGNSCEMYRICASLGDLENLKKISQVCDLDEKILKKIKYRLAIVTIPFYITNEQKSVILNCLKRLQLFCNNYLEFKIHIQYWELEPINPISIINSGDPKGYKIRILPIEEKSPSFQIIDDIVYNIDINNVKVQKMYNLITEKTLWKKCVDCFYYKGFCSERIENLNE